LTDPVWSERVSPFSFLGPKRQRNPGIDFQHLPKIDLVLLSHNHYDHLDIATLVKLQQRDQPDFITTLGVKAALTSLKSLAVSELDWWEAKSFKGLQITCTRAQHFSGRGFFDRDKSLWAGFSIKGDHDHLLFVGDSGAGDFFQEFPVKLPPIDLAIIPIGAYKPIWFMHPIHCSPKEAVQIHLDIQARKSIACHFGTFPLGDDGMYEAVEELSAERISAGLSEDTFLILKNGDSLVR
jgi:L-ascorbate metabolism protein UlaG (beta-lactamase superfamily)